MCVYLSIINFFTITWFLLCLINPLQSNPHGLYELPYINHEIENQFQSPNIPKLYSETAEKERYLQPNIPKPSVYDLFHTYSGGSGVDSWLHTNLKESVRQENYNRYNVQYNQNQKDHFKNDNVNHEPMESHDFEIEEPSEDVIEKMNYLAQILSDDSNNNDVETQNTIEDKMLSTIPEETRRVVRQVRKQKPGFFWTLARVTFETINDTRSAIQQISEIINSGFGPDTPPQKVDTSNSLIDQNKLPSNVETVNDTTTAPPTSTTEAYKFTRNGVQTLIRRNLKGLIRLFNIEWQDAVNESEKSVREFQKDLGNQVGLFLRENPQAKRNT